MTSYPLSPETPSSVDNWCSTDGNETFNKHWKNKKTRRRLIELGYSDPKTIDYRFDTEGFRTSPIIADTISNQPILTLGCSYTSGVGLNNNDIWSTVLAKLLKYQVFNAGISGSSTDSAFRTARILIPRLKPFAVFHLVTFLDRRELIADNLNSPYQYGPWDFDDNKFKQYTRLTNDEHSQMLHDEKNRLAIAHICHLNNAYYYEFTIDPFDEWKYEFNARDLQHFGKDFQTAVATEFYELYSKKVKNN